MNELIDGKYTINGTVSKKQELIAQANINEQSYVLENESNEASAPPVILIPLVLVVLALVAVSRRKGS